MLLLTATPMQNSLAELWGLVQYVEPTGTLLGGLPTFREVFCDDDDRTLFPGRSTSCSGGCRPCCSARFAARRRSSSSVPFVERRCRLYEYAMSDDERSLYDDVTAWLMREDLFAFRGSQRHLLLIGFHRRMASSLAALAASLQKRRGAPARPARTPRLRRVRRRHAAAARVRRRPRGRPRAGDASDDADDAPTHELHRRQSRCPRRDERLRAELRGRGGVRGPGRGARPRQQGASFSMPSGSSANGRRRARQRQGGRLHRVDHHAGIPAPAAARPRLQPTTTSRCFAATTTPDASAALHAGRKRWARRLPPAHRPSREVAIRLALVHEFTHAVEGLHLHRGRRQGPEPPVLRHGHQLRPAVEPAAHRAAHRPLPPLRPAARRHGRQLHRPGQRGAAADLRDPGQKLDLFGKVLDASDAVLHEPRTRRPNRWWPASAWSSRRSCAASTAARGRSTR